MKKKYLIFSFVLAVILNLSASNEELLKLRNENASNYFKPESYLKIAKYYYDNNKKIIAFYISESCRKMFGDDIFTPVFNKIASRKYKTLKDFKDEKAEEKYCLEHPDSIESQFRTIKIKYNELITNEHIEDKNIIESFKKDILPLSDYLQVKAVAAKMLLKTFNDYETAMYMYIDLYFFDPHYYDWEYAEFRIKNISSNNKEKWFEEKYDGGNNLSLELIKKEDNPRVLDVAVDYIRKNWKTDFIPIILEMFNSDDQYIQSASLHTILNNSEDFNNIEIINNFLKGNDFVKKAMASFLVVKCLGPEKYSLLNENINSKISLVQLDTIQALTMGGMEGKEYLKKNISEFCLKEIKDIYLELIRN